MNKLNLVNKRDLTTTFTKLSFSVVGITIHCRNDVDAGLVSMAALAVCDSKVTFLLGSDCKFHKLTTHFCILVRRQLG